jgi:chromosomal replication initiation ATPase DnaA
VNQLIVTEKDPGRLIRKTCRLLKGTEGFVKRIKGNFLDRKRHREILGSRFLAPDAERIKEEVCKVFGVDRAELYESKRGFSNQPRNIAIYLLCALRGNRLNQTGREFNMNLYGSVSSVVQRMSQEISNPPASPVVYRWCMSPNVGNGGQGIDT